MKSLLQHINESSIEELKTRLIELINNSDNEIPLRRAYNIMQHISDELYDKIAEKCYKKWPLGLKEVFRIIEEYSCKRDFFEELQDKNTEKSKFATLENLKAGENLFDVISEHTSFDEENFFGHDGLKQFLQKLYNSRPNDINNATGKGELLLQTMFKNATRGTGADIEIDGVGIEVKGNGARIKGNNKILKNASEMSNYIKDQLNLNSPIRIGGYRVLAKTFENLEKHNIAKETIFVAFANMYFYQCSNFNTAQQDSFNKFTENFKESNNIKSLSFINMAKILLDIHCALILISYYLYHKQHTGKGFKYLLVVNPELKYHLLDIGSIIKENSTIEKQINYILENIINKQITVYSGPDNGETANEQNTVCAIKVI